MGWSDCGLDSQGRPIGYDFKAKCDHHDCNKDIDRGLAYACGSMHGDNEIGCEKYFCESHKANWVRDDLAFFEVCDDCANSLVDSGDWKLNEDDEIVRAELCE